MTEAGPRDPDVVVTEAVRDATIGGRKVKRGQTIALDPDDGLIAVDSDREKAVLAAMTALKPGYELVTLFYGDGADLAEAEAMARKIGGGRARRRDRGPARRPALLPVPDLGRIGRAMARSAVTPEGTGRLPPPPTDPVELLDTPLAQVRAGRRRTSSVGPASGSTSTRSATCSSTCRGGTTTCARCGASATCTGARTARSSRSRRRSATCASSPAFRRPHPAHVARLEDDTGSDRGDVVRAPLHRAPAARSAARSWCPARLKHFGRKLTLDNPEFQVVDRRGEVLHAGRIVPVYRADGRA